MLQSKTIKKLTILRLIAVMAVASFSFEMTSPFFVSEDAQLEIVDVDLEDDTETDDEFDSSDSFLLFGNSSAFITLTQQEDLFFLPLRDQHLEELPTPPPDVA